MSQSVLDFIKENDVKFIDLRFTDTKGKEQHVSIPHHQVDEDFFEDGKMFDGSSIAGWKGINESDMVLMPVPESIKLDPFTEEATLILRCDVVEPSTLQGYERDPRSVAKRAEDYMRSTGIADTVLFGPEPEFFVFDDVKYKSDMSGSMYKIDSKQAAWNSDKEYADGNTGHRPGVKGGYFPVAPVDDFQDWRSATCLVLEEMGQVVEAHHHEVATAGQNEIATRFNTMVLKADEIQEMKYVIHNMAHLYGKTATFMPKPVVGDNGSGMHCHQSLAKDGVNLFAGDKYGGLSEDALYYIGGIIKHQSVSQWFHLKKVVVLKYASRIQQLTHTLLSQQCLWLALMVSKTRSTLAMLWIKIYTTYQLKKQQKFQLLQHHLTKHYLHSAQTVNS